MGYAILHTLGEIIEKNNLIKTVMHTTTSPSGVENNYKYKLQKIFDRNNYCCYLANVLNWQVIKNQFSFLCRPKER